MPPLYLEQLAKVDLNRVHYDFLAACVLQGLMPLCLEQYNIARFLSIGLSDCVCQSVKPAASNRKNSGLS
jgi:hypothetical protein